MCHKYLKKEKLCWWLICITTMVCDCMSFCYLLYTFAVLT